MSHTVEVENPEGLELHENVIQDDVSSVRSRTKTQKGYEYEVDVCKTNFLSAKTAWKRVYIEINNRLDDLEFNQIKEARISLVTKFEAVQNAYDRYEALEPSNKFTDQYIKCEEDTQRLIFDIRERSKQFVQVAGSIRSSGHSRCSSISSSKGQKELIEKLAKLDLEMLEVKNEIQNVKLEESGVESKQDYTRRYVESHLKTLPHHKHIVSESKVKSNEDLREKLNLDDEYASNLNPKANSFFPKDEVLVNQTDESSCSGRTEEKNAIQQLAEILCARQISDSLPRPEPEVFKGDILQYSMWVKSFDTLIESKTKVAAERMYYLSKYTDGEAKEVISGLLLLDSTEAYSKARKLLKQRFGNAFVIANAYREKLHEWPRIPLSDGPALMKFSDFLETCKTAMSNIQYLNILNDPKENQRMLQKLATSYS
ncbi:uncharacterized protein LOC134762997 [Penaeus indicus]|uniref:uncharacterized protein LOC134762997 n=1 Tax=Penaeus indicus TaxID=29960 RepID=UPI00300D95EE